MLPEAGMAEQRGSRPQSALTVLAATRLEAVMAQLAMPRGIAVERVGVGLRGWTPSAPRPFVSCGLAGSLCASIRPGTVVVPDRVGLPDGECFSCSALAVRQLVDEARRLGFEAVVGPLITLPFIATGESRAAWRDRGFIAADMETGLLLRWCSQGAAARVILDSPERELAPRWSSPRRVGIDPRLWPELAWLGIAAPRFAQRSGRVVAAAAPGLLTSLKRGPGCTGTLTD